MAQPAKYKFYLGKTPDTTTNLVTNGTFTGSLTGWSVGANTGWSSVSNTAEFSFGVPLLINDLSANCSLEQSNILTEGENYYFSYDLKRATAGSGTYNRGRVSWSFGGLYFTPFKDYDQNDSTTFVKQIHKSVYCANGNDFLFYADNGERSAIDNVEIYKNVWNAPLITEPIGWEEAKITKKRDNILNGLIVNYITDLTFINDGYEYLYNQYLLNGFCGEIEIKIDYYNSSTGLYEDYFTGFIYLKDCKFNLTRKQVSISIEDSNSSLIFLNNKEVKCDVNSIYYQDAGNNYPKAAPNTDMLIDFNDDSGAYPTGGLYDDNLVYRVGAVLKNIVYQSNKYRFYFKSDFFDTGTFQYFGLINPNYEKLSFEDLFRELNNLFNITFSIDNTTVFPTIVVEPKNDYYNSVPVLSINYVNDLEFSFDENSIYKTISIGYKHIDDTPANTNYDTPEGEQYFTSNLCAKNDLKLVSDYIQKSSVIKGFYAGTYTDTKYANVLRWIETDGTLTKNTGSGDRDYNYNIDTLDNLTRHLYTLNTDFISTPNGQVVNTPITEAIKANENRPLIYSFKYPLTKAQFDLIEQAYNTIEFDTDGTPATRKTGFVLEASYDIKTGLTDFKLLSS
jgi:hypothetical protein